MSKKRSKSISDFFTDKRQHACGSGATTSMQLSRIGQTRISDCPHTSQFFGEPSVPIAMEEDSKDDDSVSDSYLAIDKDINKKDEIDHFSQQSDDSVDSGHYYRKNFLDVLKEVQDNENIRVLFRPLELKLLEAFREMNPDEQMLYVRLLNRKHAWLKTSSIKYFELSSELDAVVNLLIDKGFLCADISEEDTSVLLNLMPLQEVKALCKCFRMKCDDKKENLIKSLIDFGHRQKSIHRGISKGINSLVRERAMKTLGKMVKLNSIPRKLFLRVVLLHSLPLSREMEMDGRIPIMNVISRVNSNQIIFPDYPLHPLKNFFGSFSKFIRFQEVLELLAIMKGKMLNKHHEEVLCLYDTAINHLRRVLEDSKHRKEDLELPLYLRSFTAGYVLVRAVMISIECLKIKKRYSEAVVAYQVLLSQDIYVSHHRGKWYDQLALIHHHHLKNVPAAMDVLMKGLNEKSLSPVDELLLSNRGLMIANKKSTNREEMEKNNILISMIRRVEDPPEFTITATCMSSKIGLGSKLSYLNQSPDGISHALSSVEEAVIHHHKKQGFDKGIHAENALSLSIFGIFFWDIIYLLDVGNVFLCLYQNQPLDLKSGEFYENRKESIDERLREMEEVWTIDTMRGHLRNVYSQEQGKESIVSWRTFEDLDQFEMLLECIGLPIISKICKRIAKDFPTSRRGFPDIIIWNSASKKCKFLEVKGPGDRLSPSQVLWLNYLNDSGADAAVCHVKSLGSKFLKRKYEGSGSTDVIDLE